MTEITPVLGVDPAELRKAVKVIGRLLNDKSLVDLAEQGSTQDIVYVIGHRVYTDKCHRKAVLEDIKDPHHFSNHCKFEDVLVLKALLDLRADPDKRLSVWKGNQTASDIIRNKINVLLTAGVVDAKERIEIVEKGRVFTEDPFPDEENLIPEEETPFPDEEVPATKEVAEDDERVSSFFALLDEPGLKGAVKRVLNDPDAKITITFDSTGYEYFIGLSNNAIHKLNSKKQLDIGNLTYARHPFPVLDEPDAPPEEPQND